MIFVLFLLSWIFYKIGVHIMDGVEKKREILWPDYEDKALQILCFRADLDNLIWKMEDDPFTSDTDWERLLPICQYADEWYAKTYPAKNFHRKVDLVRSLMD
jgi:hypothetical protein